MARKVWARDLENEGLTEADIHRGLKASRTEEWPPTVGEFIAGCRPSAAQLGVPEPRAAYIAACRGIWPHPIVYHVAGEIGRYELRTRTERETWPAFEALYKRALNELRRGRTFEMPTRRERLLEPPPKPTAEDIEREKATFQETVARARAGRL